jgi:hypothetical protein
MSQPFENVREQLLRAGIAPRHANRYVTELREHLADVSARERATGQDARQAQERALALMGSDAQLVQSVLDRGAPRSLAARAPWSVFAVLPVVLLVAVILVTGFSMFQLLLPVRGLAPSEMPTGYVGLVTVISFISSYLIGPLLAAGCIAVALRQRLASGWVWVGLALVALVSGPLGFHMHSIASDNGEMHTVYSGVGLVFLNGHANLAATLGLAALRTVVLFTMAATAYRVLQSRFMDRASLT